ncbi:MAG: energy transducer TonB [Janthinobacterium lividum]
MKNQLLLLALALLAASPGAFGQRAAGSSAFERGTLSQGQPTGVWEYFDEAGQLELRMNYDSSRIGYRRPDTARYELQVGGAWQLVHPSRAPGPMGSRAGRRHELQTQLRYPVSALQQQQQGDVLLSYVVDPTGHTSHYSIERSLSPACDQEVWRVLQLLPDRWIPAVYRGQAVAARFYLAVHFEMQQVERRPRPGAAPTLPAPGLPPYTDRINVVAVGVARGGQPR